MSAKFQNKYRGESTRLQRWDYGWDAAYFITICTLDRESFFGNVRKGEMELSPVGVIADVLWYEIKNHAKCAIGGICGDAQSYSWNYHIEWK